MEEIEEAIDRLQKVLIFYMMNGDQGIISFLLKIYQGLERMK